MRQFGPLNDQKTSFFTQKTANPERWNQRCFLFIQSVINAKLSLEFFHGLFINLPSLLIMKGCTILIRKKWPRWIFCFGDKTCIMKDSFIIRRCNYSGLHCIHSSKFNIQRQLYCQYASSEILTKTTMNCCQKKVTLALLLTE